MVDHVHGQIGQHVLLELLDGVAVVDEVAVLVQRVVEDALRGPVGARVPLRPAGRHERRPRPGTAVAVQELADLDGGVARVLEPERERVVVVEVGEASALIGAVAAHIVVLGVLAREQRRPRRAADGPVDEAVGEGDAVVADLGVDLVHDPHLAGVHVVGEKDDDVGIGLLLLLGVSGRRVARALRDQPRSECREQRDPCQGPQKA
jgi:hypothetical protein